MHVMSEFTSKIRILGIAQDAGVPQAGCYCIICAGAREDPSLRRHAASLALIEPGQGRWHLCEATPDLPAQLHMMKEAYPNLGVMDSVFLTHAHIGHYAGLMYLGREAMATQGIKVYAGEGMTRLLSNSAPWQQLVSLGNIALQGLSCGHPIVLSPTLSVTPLEVPHRNEYAETFGFIIKGPTRKALFIPDIDRWEQASFDTTHLAAQMDYCLIDATFFDSAELPGRDLREIPHPFASHSMDLLQPLVDKGQTQVIFIHLNHSNPLLLSNSPQFKETLRREFKVAYEGMELEL